MKALVLAAGYATRMYPLTQDRPKALLPVAGKAVIDYLLDAVRSTDRAHDFYIVTNHRFYSQFQNWRLELPGAEHVKIIDDATASNETRLGAIGDIQFVLDHTGIDDDLLVMAADNIFGFSFADYFTFFGEKGTDCVARYSLHSETELQRTAVLEVDDNDRVIGCIEKPNKPKSHYACPPVYIYRRDTLPLFRQYLDEGNNPDAPGYFVEWLIHRRRVHAFFFNEPRYDIGDLESYREICELFESRKGVSDATGSSGIA